MRTQSEPLDVRKQRILKAVVHKHVETAEPVASEMLVQHYHLGVRSATIRNEMAELAEMGYLRQPHTSAGRVPSDQGYRFYVDRLMGRAYLREREVLAARQRLTEVADELDRIINHTCRILTGLTRYTSVAIRTSIDEITIRHISLSKVGNEKLLLIVALSDGQVEHRIVDCQTAVQESEAVQASNLLSARFVGKTLQQINDADQTDLFAEKQSPGSIYSMSFNLLSQMAESLSLSEPSVHVEGTHCVLKQPEFQDLSRLEAILTALEERTRLYQLLTRAVLGPNVTIIIGSENPYREMQDASFIAARYRIGDRTAGTIGIIGPTRLDYRRAVAAVDAMARNLSELLTTLSLC